MVDRDESALHAVQLSIEGRAMLDSPDIVLLDLRDRDGVRGLLSTRLPEVVFHAAALKHLPLLQPYPVEAVLTNVFGMLDLLVGTHRIRGPGHRRRPPHCHPSRRPAVFHDGEEAVELVIQAGAIGRSGEALVFDMGQPVRIDDAGRFLAERAERHVDIVDTGLRPGEKLKEVLLGEGEEDDRPLHPLISHVSVPPLDPDNLSWINLTAPPGEIIEALGRASHTATRGQQVRSKARFISES